MLFRSRVFNNIAPLFNPSSISFIEPRLELKDKDLEDEKFQMEDTHHNPGPIEEIIKEEDLNIDWTNEENVERANDERVRARSDENGVGHMFGSYSKLSQKDVDKIILKYKIPNQYLYRAPK